MYRRLIAIALLLTAAAVLPESDAQQRCPRGVQVNNIQQRSQQQFQQQQAERKVREETQRRIQETQRQAESKRMQVETRNRSVTTMQAKSVPTQTTTLVPKVREVATPTRNITTNSRSITTVERGIIPPPPGRGVGPGPTPVPWTKSNTITQTNRSVTDGVTRSKVVDMVPVTQRGVTTERKSITSNSREVTMRPVSITSTQRELTNSSRSIRTESVKLNTKSRSVHELKNVTTLKWNTSCLSCHQSPPQTREPVVTNRPRQPEPRTPILEPRRPNDGPNMVRRPDPRMPEVVRPTPRPIPEMLGRLPQRPPVLIPAFPPDRFPVIDLRPRPTPNIIPGPRPTPDRPMPEPITDRPRNTPEPKLFEPVVTRPERMKGRPAPEAVERAVLEAIPREVLERPAPPAAVDAVRDPVGVARHGSNRGAGETLGHGDAPATPAPPPVYSEADLQAPALPGLPESVLVVRRSEEVFDFSATPELMPSMTDLVEAQEQIPDELQTPSQSAPRGGRQAVVSAATGPLAAPSLPALPESVLGRN